MVLIYAFVARKQTVLAEYTSYSGNFSTVATQVRGREASSSSSLAIASRRAPGDRWFARERARTGASARTRWNTNARAFERKIKGIQD